MKSNINTDKKSQEKSHTTEGGAKRRSAKGNEEPNAITKCRKSPKSVDDLEPNEIENREGEFERYGPFTCIAESGLHILNDGRSHYLCEPLFVIGNSTDNQGRNAKIRFRFRNRLEIDTTVAIPIEDVDSPAQLLRRLKQAGFPMEAGSSEIVGRAIAQYTRLACQVRQTSIETNRNGWHELPDATTVYVSDSECFGKASEKYNAYRSDAPSPLQRDKAKPKAWKALLKQLDADHLVVFGMCAVFAAALLGPLKSNALMLYFVGASSTGKTILLRLLASVFGSPHDLFTFSGTDNGIEANALAHRDRAFVIDEVGQATGRQFSRFAYSIANGASRQRACSNGSAAAVEAIRTVLVSAGELTPQGLMAESGIDAKQGQDARLTVIPVSEEYGVWTTLGSFSSGAAKSEYVAAQLEAVCGIAGRQFCKRVAPNVEEIAAEFHSALQRLSERIRGDIVFDDGDHAAGRVLRQFALFAYAGAVAVEVSVLPWTEEVILAAARHCYALWYADHRAKRPAKEDELIAPVRLFLQSHRGTKFKPFDAWRDEHHGTVAGFDYSKRNGDSFFIFHPGFFDASFCSVTPRKQVLDALKHAGYLATASDGGPTVQIQLPGAGKNHRGTFYAIRKTILHA